MSTSVTDFLRACELESYASRFIEQGVETVDDLRYERDLDGLLEDVGLSGGDATTFRRALSDALARVSGGREEKKAKDGPVDLAAAVAAAAAASRTRQGLDGASGTGTSGGRGGVVRQSGARESDHAPRLSVDATVMDEVNARLGVATGQEIEDILRFHEERDFLRLLKLREVSIDHVGRVEWAGHEAMKVNEIAMRCKLLSLRLDVSRNSHPKAPLAQRAVKNVLDLLSHNETRREFLTIAVRKRVDELRAEGKLAPGGHVTITGVHYGSGAAATRAAEENYVSKDMLGDIPKYDESIHVEGSERDAANAPPVDQLKKAAAPKVDVSSIRTKLANKAKKPRFM